MLEVARPYCKERGVNIKRYFKRREYMRRRLDRNGVEYKRRSALHNKINPKWLQGFTSRWGAAYTFVSCVSDWVSYYWPERLLPRLKDGDD